MEHGNHPANTESKARRFGCNLSGGKFSSMHGDLVTEIINGETKRQAGSHRGEFSVDKEALNKWVITAHINAKLRSEVKDIMHLSTNSIHKKCILSGYVLFLNHVESLKSKLVKYNINPFGEGPTKDLTIVKELGKNIMKGLIYAPSFGNEKFVEFMEERSVNGAVIFFSQIKIVSINTGLKKNKKNKEHYHMDKRRSSSLLNSS